MDYRQQKEITIKDRMPLPLIGESLDKFANAIIYTKLNIRDAYYNLQIAEGDEWKMAFRTPYRLYEYCVMPFWLTNALTSFQRWMNEILSDYLDIFCVAYVTPSALVTPQGMQLVRLAGLNLRIEAE